MQELLPECSVWYAGAITRVQGVVCRSYNLSTGCGMQELLPKCRVLPECRVWYAGSTSAAVVGGVAELAHLYYSVENLELVT